MYKFNFKSYDNSYQSISYCEVDKCKAVISLQQQLDQLKAENEELKINNAQFIKDNEFLAKRNSKLKAELEQEKNWHKTSDEISKANSEYTDKLKAENEELKKEVDDLLHKPEIQDKILWKIDNEALLGSKNAYIYKLHKTLTEIKEILIKTPTDSQEHCVNAKSVILQKISEVEDGQ